MKELKGFTHGVNLGGWLSQCDHSKERYDTFIKEEDIKRIASWGLDHVRLPIDYELVETEDGAVIESGYSYIDSCISWCKKYGLNMILDLHKTAGYVFDNQEYSKGFFEQPELMDRFVNLWIKLAKRFVKDKDILIFELLNEIVNPDVYEEWNQLAARTVEAIRGVDPDVRIMYGGVCYNSVTSVKLLAKPKYDNVIFTFHCYEPLIFTHQAAYWCEGMPSDYRVSYPETLERYVEDTKKNLDPIMVGTYYETAIDISKLCDPEFFRILFKEAIETAEKYDVPLYCGEYGVIDQADISSTVKWYQDITQVFNEKNIGRAAWSYKQMDFGVIDEHYDPIREELLKLL